MLQTVIPLVLLSVLWAGGRVQALIVDATNAAALAPLIAINYSCIIVGGGTAGLALGSRLSAGNPALSVLIIEAGPLVTNNPAIYVPGFAGSTLGTPLDWSFNTVPQANANGRTIFTPRGKILSGTSAINFLAYTRGSFAEYAAWVYLIHNSRWSWMSLLPFFKASENFHSWTGDSQNATVTFESSVHGLSGPVGTSYPPFISPQFVALAQSLGNAGVPLALDLASGVNLGWSYAPSTIDPAGYTRATSMDYYNLVANQSNLYIFTNTQATSILWTTTCHASCPQAGGVRFVSAGITYTAVGSSAFFSADLNLTLDAGEWQKITCKGQVVLSAGSIQTPQLLELSGIGNPAVINPLGIPTVVNLPGVGNNLQDHPAVVVVFELAPGFESLDGLASNATRLNAALAAYAGGSGILTQALYTLSYLSSSLLFSLADQATALGLFSAQVTGSAISAAQLALSQQLFEKGVPQIEVLGINVYFGNSSGQDGVSYLSVAACQQHPLSRGSVHITSSNPLSPPSIDPNYLQHPFDTFVLSKAAQYIRTLASDPALAAVIQSEAEPGPTVQTEADFEEWVRESVRTEYHPVGTAPMLVQSAGGVVDSSLKVYGTQNLRVVDLSVVPLHLSTHPQSVAYAIAEQAASILLPLLVGA